MSKLAIIIPYYKLTFFRETLESLKNQTDKRFHVYIGNDASRENPEELLKEFMGDFKFTYQEFKKNIGASSLTQQWDRCINMMKDEEWFMILGDDDYLGINVVEEFYKDIEYINVNHNVVRFSLQVVDEASLVISEICINPIIEKPFDAHFKKVSGEVIGSLSEYIFRKSAYLKFRFKEYDLAWGSDNRAVIDFSEKKTIYSINEAFVSFRISKSNITGSGDVEIKNRSLARQRRDLFADYKNDLNAEQKEKLLHEYENILFSCGRLEVGYYIDLLTWRYIYGNKSKLIISFKSVVAKFLKL